MPKRSIAVHFGFDSLEYMNSKRGLFGLIMLVVGALAVNLLFTLITHGFKGDEACFASWMVDMVSSGIVDAYTFSSSLNYPPIYPLILYVFGKMINFPYSQPILPVTFLIKAPILIINSLATISLAFLIKRNIKKWIWPFVFFVLNPALIYVGPIWGQVDILHSFLMGLTLLSLPFAPFISGLLYSVGLLSKFQTITIIPVIAIYLLIQCFKGKKKSLLLFAAGFLIPIIIVFGFFLSIGGLKIMIYKGYLSAVGFYPVATLNAYNIWYLFGFDITTPDSLQLIPGITLKVLGLGLLSMATVYALSYLFFIEQVKVHNLLKSSLIVTFSFFMLATQMHERYSVPALVIALLLLFFESKWLWLTVGLTFSVLVNLAMINKEFLPIQNLDTFNTVRIMIVLLNCLILGWMIWSTSREMSTANFRNFFKSGQKHDIYN